jgi:hypothetical protein
MKNCNTIIPQNPPPNRRVEELSTVQENFQQLELFALPPKRQKPQISSVPGTHPLERNRYQVTMGGKAIASKVNANEASLLAKLIQKRQLTESIEFLEQRGILNQQVQVFLLSAIGGEG